MYWIFPYLCIRNELFDSIAPQNAENRTVANSLLLFLKCSVKCLFLKWLCQTVENLKYVAGEFTEEEYAPLKGLRYNMGTNYGTYTSIIKDGDTVGLYKFVIEGIEPYNMEGTPWWYYGIYPADADFFSETEPEPIYKQLFEQPQTEGEEHFIYPIIYASSGTFD